MITFTNTIDIARAINEVYEYLADLRNIPDWNWAIESTEPTSQGPIRVGSTFRQIRNTPTRSVEELQITELQQNERIVVSGQLGPFNACITYDLRSGHNGTTVENRIALEATGPTRMLSSLMGPRVSRSVASNLADLKRLLESQAPVDPATRFSQRPALTHHQARETDPKSETPPRSSATPIN